MTQNVNVAIANAEQARANRVNEYETRRHNTAVEMENWRSHIMQEQHNRNVLAENIRHAMATERQARLDLWEKTRAAKASESLRTRELHEAARHNRQSESITAMHNLRQHQARLGELREATRAHKASEQLSGQQNRTRLLEVQGNLGLRSEELATKKLLDTRSLDIKERDVYFQHSDREGNLQIGAYNAKTDRLGTFLKSMSLLLTRGSSK